MNKLLFIAMFSICLPAYSAEITANQLAFQSDLLKQKYSPYEIILKNDNDNPLKINNLNCQNAVNDNEKLNNSYHPTSKRLRTLLILAPFTLGITDLFAIPIMNKDLEITKKSQVEAVKYNTSKLAQMKDVVIPPKQQIRLLVAVPLNEKPVMNAVFQDTVTNKYINVELK